MSTGIDAVEERIKRLEKYVLGQDILRQDDEQVNRNNSSLIKLKLFGLLIQNISYLQLIDTLLAVSRKLASVVSKNEKVSAALKRGTVN